MAGWKAPFVSNQIILTRGNDDLIQLDNGTTIVDKDGNIDAPTTTTTLTVSGTSTLATTTVSTTLGVTGVSTLTGGAVVGGTLIQWGTGAITATSGAGAIAVTGQIHEVTTAGAGDAMTLANGTAGQRLCVILVAEGGTGSDTAVITPTTLAGGATVTLNAIWDSADLIYSATGWWYVLWLGGSAAVA